MTLPFPGVKGPLNEHIPLLIEELENRGVKIEKFYYGRRQHRAIFRTRIFHLLVNLFGFVKIIYSKEIHIIQFNTSFDRDALLRDVFFVTVARLAAKKVFVKMHGSFYYLLYTKSHFWFFYACILFKFSHKVGFLSAKEKEEFSEVFKAFENKFIVVKNALDLKMLKDQTLKSRRDGQFRILYASRIMREKGIFDVIGAIPAVLKEIDAHFVFAGSGKDEIEAKISIEKLNNAAGKITWLGDVPSHKMKDVFAAADLFVFPTYFPEGMPMALVNAMVLGLPILTTKVRFAQGYIKEPDNCLFVEHNNSKQLADKILYLFSHPETRNRMSDNNRKLYTEFDKAIVAQEHLELYKQLFEKIDNSMSKEKILFIVPFPPPYAGPEVASKILLESAIKERIEVITLCSNVHTRNKDKGKINFYSIMKFIVLILQITWLILYRRPKAIYALLSQNLTGFIRDSIIIVIAKVTGKKVILHFHGSNFHNFYVSQPQYFQTYISWILKKVDGIIIQTFWLREIFSQFIAEDKLKVIYNPINMDSAIDSSEIHKRSKGKDITVLYFSNISVAKGFLVLAKAMKEIVCQEHNIKFIIAGSAIDRERNIFYDQDGKKIEFQNISELIGEIKNNRVFENKIIFLNEITSLEQKLKVFSQSDIFVLPSYSEGCPMVVLEAMSAGLPVVVTPVGALVEIIKDYKNGFFIPLGDAAELKNKILFLAANPSLRNEMGRQNLELIRRDFSIDKITPQFSDFFQQTLKS
jgi:glycosyltransferase involved in cell wall biosynthesis